MVRSLPFLVVLTAAFAAGSCEGASEAFGADYLLDCCGVHSDAEEAGECDCGACHEDYEDVTDDAGYSGASETVQGVDVECEGLICKCALAGDDSKCKNENGIRSPMYAKFGCTVDSDSSLSAATKLAVQKHMNDESVMFSDARASVADTMDTEDTAELMEASTLMEAGNTRRRRRNREKTRRRRRGNAGTRRRRARRRRRAGMGPLKVPPPPEGKMKVETWDAPFVEDASDEWENLFTQDFDDGVGKFISSSRLGLDWDRTMKVT